MANFRDIPTALDSKFRYRTIVLIGAEVESNPFEEVHHHHPSHTLVDRSKAQDIRAGSPSLRPCRGLVAQVPIHKLGTTAREVKERLVPLLPVPWVLQVLCNFGKHFCRKVEKADDAAWRRRRD